MSTIYANGFSDRSDKEIRLKMLNGLSELLKRESFEAGLVDSFMNTIAGTFIEIKI